MKLIDKGKQICKQVLQWLHKPNRTSILFSIAAIIICISLVFSLLIRVIPIPCTLKLGFFSTSNWDVPQFDTYKQIDEIIDRFEKENPNINVEYTSGIIKNDYSDWLNNQIVKGECPDVFFILNSDFSILSETEALMDLGPYLSKEDISLEEKFYKNAFDDGSYNGKQFALPVECNMDLMFVNTDILKQNQIPIPDRDWTIDDLIEICQKITKDTNQDGVPDHFGIANYGFLNMIEASDLELFNHNASEIRLDNPEVLDVIDKCRSLQKYNADSYLFGQAKDFNSGAVAFTPLSYAEYCTYQPEPWNIKKYSSFNWTALPMPSLNADSKRGELDTLLMGISSRTTQPAKAWKLLSSFTLYPSSQSELDNLMTGFSPLKEVSLHHIDQDSDSLSTETLIWSIERSKRIPKFKKYQKAEAFLDTAINKILKTEENQELLLLEAQKQINSFLTE